MNKAIFNFLALALFIIPFSTALNIEQGSILKIDNIYNVTVVYNLTLDQLTITDSFMQFYNITDGGFKNTNNTGNVRLDLFGLTSALVYNTNGSIYGSSNIADNNGQLNITLPPNNASYVLDSFTLDEHTIRQNNPLSITDINREYIRITSSLATTIIVANAQVYANGVDCRGVLGVTTSGGGSYTGCSGGYLQFSSLNLNSGYNYITINEGSGNPLNAFNDAFLALMGGLGGVISIMLIIGTFYMHLYGKMPLQTFIKCLMIEIVGFLVAGTVVILAL